jgi:hypothetical protein
MIIIKNHFESTKLPFNIIIEIFVFKSISDCAFEMKKNIIIPD